ncbi:hypothetical protein C4F17_28375 [Variovorax sp. PMC12]|nr:hypothetical protein C4F17_28375 [Variovorax sp. PMC12]
MSYAEQMSNVGRAVWVGAVGATEMVLKGAYNYGVRLAGGVASIPYLLDSVDAAVAVQEGFKERFGAELKSEGARAFGQAMQPVGQWVQGNIVNPVLAYSESKIGIGPTAFLSASAQAGLEIAGVVTGARAAQGFLDEVAFVGMAPRGALNGAIPGAEALAAVRVYSGNAIRQDILTALPEGASLVQTTRGGAAIVRFGDDAFYNVPRQANAAAYSQVFSDLRTMDC